MRFFVKGPVSKLDFAIDWDAWVSAPGDGDAVTSSTWSVPTGITKESDSLADNKATIWLSTSTLGQEYTLTNSIVTLLGRQDSRWIRIKVVNR